MSIRPSTEKFRGEICPTHGCQAKFFCQSGLCKVSVCEICWKNDHKGHNVELLEHILDQSTQKISKALELSETGQKQILKISSEIDDLNKDLIVSVRAFTSLKNEKQQIHNMSTLSQVRNLEENIKNELEDIKAKNSNIKQKILKMETLANLCEEVNKDIQSSIEALNVTNRSTAEGKVDNNNQKYEIQQNHKAS